MSKRKQYTLKNGSNMNRKLIRTDIRMKMNAYTEKVEAYSKLSLEELKEMFFEHTVGGVYREALLHVIKNYDAIQQSKTVETQKA